MNTKKRIFLVIGLTLVLTTLLAGCGGGKDSSTSDLEKATSDYLGVVANRKLNYYTKIIYEKEEPAYSDGSLQFTTAAGNLYSFTDELSLFRDNITHTTYQYIRVNGRNCYLLEESSETTGVLALSNPVTVGSTSGIWGKCTATEDVNIPVYEGTADSGSSYPGCLVFEETGAGDEGSTLTVKVWFAPNIGIVKKEEVITGAPGYVSATRTWYLYGLGSAAKASTLKSASMKIIKNQDIIDKFDALINKTWTKQTIN